MYRYLALCRVIKILLSYSKVDIKKIFQNVVKFFRSILNGPGTSKKFGIKKMQAKYNIPFKLSVSAKKIDRGYLGHLYISES